MQTIRCPRNRVKLSFDRARLDCSFRQERVAEDRGREAPHRPTRSPVTLSPRGLDSDWELNGSEFRSGVFGDTVRELGATQTFIRAGRPATNGAVERVQRPILEECWRPSFARSLVPKLTGLTRDLAAYLRFYNEERAHTGRLTQGKTPLEALIGARKMRPR